MGALKQYVLLALVLLEVAVCAEDDECRGQRTNCEVTEVSGDVVIVECGGDKVRPTVQRKVIPESKKPNVTISRTFWMRHLAHRKVGETPENSYSINKTTDENSFDDQITDILSVSELNTTKDYSDYIILADNQSKMILNNKYIKNNTDDEQLIFMKHNCTSESSAKLWSNITTVSVNLLNHSLVLNLRNFPNAKTLFFNSSGFSLGTLCGAENVTTLAITSSKIRSVNFIRNLSNLKYLNLSDNIINAIPVADLPPTVTSLDLSFNSVSFYANLSLPETLQLLNISYNNIRIEDKVILKGNAIVLDVRGNRLVDVPFFDMITLEELYLSENNISIIQEGTFTNLTSLTILDLRKNCLNNLEERVFQGLNKLQWLDMSENNVLSLAPSTFQYLNNLVTLLLSGNRKLGNLQDVEDSSFLFGTGQRLQIIKASRTNLTKVPSTLTRSVKQLLLADNAIVNIQCGELDSFPLLQVLDVSNNFIRDVEEDALGRLDFLSHLLLSGNKLTSVPKSLPNQLQVLDLRCNSINKLNNFDFLGLQKLQVLLLSRNKITIVEDGAFGQLSSLDVLDLSHNPIKSLSRTSFVGPRKLKEIYLVSLTDLVPLQEPLSFPAPESAHLEVLNMDSSPVLATQLMDDVAALTMFHELYVLNLNHCRLSTLRSDLPKYLPRLHKLELTGNVLNCTNIIWLVKWLQALNISMQDTGKFRREIYNLKDICCEEVNGGNSNDEASVICASPEYLSGKQISSLTEEDFPDLKLTSPTLPPATQVFITEPYLAQTFTNSAHNTSPSVSNMIDFPTKTTLSFYNITKPTSQNLLPSASTSLSSNEANITKPKLLRRKYSKLSYVSDKTHIKTTKITNRAPQKWKYLKSDTKYKLSSSDPVVVLLNETNSNITDSDNQLNYSIRSGAYLAHELPPSSHPGMVVFLLVVCAILVASSVMVYSQCSQKRDGREYHPHQDIEVSNLGGNELW